jgi:PEP-CTERM/exosortase A-associated glycosyltransferase
MTLRVLHVLDHSVPLHSGYTFRTLAILREQRALGWETFHLTSPKQNGVNGDEEDVDGLRFYRTRWAPRRLQTIPAIRELALMRASERRLEELVTQVKPNLIHAHSPVLNAIPALRVGRRHRLPVVYEVRAFWEDAAVDHGTASEWGVRYRLSRAVETYALKRVDAVTCICEGLRRDIVARGIPSERITVIPNAVDIEKFRAQAHADNALEKSLGLEGAVVLGFLGSFYAYEGLGLLLDALPGIITEEPRARVLLVGGGPQDAALKKQAQHLGVADKVIFAGRVPHADVNRYYDLVDVLVYPRLAMRLTDLVTPLKPLEAMAQGRLLVASDVGGHRELIRDGANGFLFAAGSATALSDKVLEVLAHRERWMGIETRAREFVETERNWRQSVSRYQSVYHDALAALGA